MDLQEIVTRRGGRHLHKIQTNRTPPARRNRQRIEQASWAAVLRLNPLTSWTRANEEVEDGDIGVFDYPLCVIMCNSMCNRQPHVQ